MVTPSSREAPASNRHLFLFLFAVFFINHLIFAFFFLIRFVRSSLNPVPVRYGLRRRLSECGRKPILPSCRVAVCVDEEEDMKSRALMA